MVITAVIALGLDKGFYAPLRRGRKPVTMLIASIGVTLMIQGLIRLFFGTGTRQLRDRAEGHLPRRGRRPRRSTSPSRSC